MRTTLTLDDDVKALLKRVLATRKVSLKAVVNEALRHGLREMWTPRKRAARYRTPSVDTGRPLLPNVDDVAEVLALDEGDRHK